MPNYWHSFQSCSGDPIDECSAEVSHVLQSCTEFTTHFASNFYDIWITFLIFSYRGLARGGAIQPLITNLPGSLCTFRPAYAAALTVASVKFQVLVISRSLIQPLTVLSLIPHIDSHPIARNSGIDSQTPENVSHVAMWITLLSPLICRAPYAKLGTS